MFRALVPNGFLQYNDSRKFREAIFTEKREKTLSIIQICAHAVPSALFALTVLTLIIGSFTYGGTWDKISALFLYPYMPLSILGGVVGAVLDVRKIVRKEHPVKNALLLPLCAVHILLGIWFLLLHEAFSA